MADVEEAARRLLRALSEHQAHGREDAAVKPGEEAMDAGLRPGSPSTARRCGGSWTTMRWFPTGGPTSGSGTRSEPSTTTSRSGSPTTAWTCCA